MSSGAEHYLAAERLLRAAEDASMDETMLDEDEYLFAAQVHATLALAAATAANIRRNGAVTSLATFSGEGVRENNIVSEWYGVLG